MKHLFTTLSILVLALCTAQAQIFVHEAQTTNTTAASTVIDNALLNSQPNARPIISHYYGLDDDVMENETITGVIYDETVNKWRIKTEDNSDMIVGSKYFVYVPTSGSSFLHDANGTNTIGLSSLIDHASFNNNPDKVFVLTHNMDLNTSNKNYALDYDEVQNKWTLITEDHATFPQDQFFHLADASGTGITTFRHQVLASNIPEYDSDCTLLDNPALNNNPDARFVFSHVYTVGGGFMDTPFTAYYFDLEGKWGLCREDFGFIYEQESFNVIVQTTATSVDNTSETPIVSVFPNPIENYINLKSPEAIQEIEIYSLDGKKIVSRQLNLIEGSVDVSALQAGVYTVRIITTHGIEVTRVIKK